MKSNSNSKRVDTQNLNLKEQVVSINRVTKVVKGGKNMSFSALVVVGDPSAKVVGYGTGKAKEVPSAFSRPPFGIPSSAASEVGLCCSSRRRPVPESLRVARCAPLSKQSASPMC